MSMARPASVGRRRALPTTSTGKRKRFIEVLTETLNVSRAAREAGIATSTAYSWRLKYDAFGKDWEAAVTAAVDELEAVLLKRAVNGVAKDVMYGGAKVGTVTTYSDALAIFMLKQWRLWLWICKK